MLTYKQPTDKVQDLEQTNKEWIPRGFTSRIRNISKLNISGKFNHNINQLERLSLIKDKELI